MNKLSMDREAQIIRALVEGNSIRAVCRIMGTEKRTVTRSLVKAAAGAYAHQNRVLRNLTCKRTQCDEIWSYVGAKQKNVTPERSAKRIVGDARVAIDAQTKLVPRWYVGGRGSGSATTFIADLAARLTHRVQLTGSPDTKHISTSYVDQNLTMRMGMRRFARLTHGFYKKIENHKASVALHFLHYNFVRVHQTLGVTPAIEGGIANRIWSFEEIVGLADARQMERAA